MEIIGSTINFSSIERLIDNPQKRLYKESLVPDKFIKLVDGDHILEQTVELENKSSCNIFADSDHIELQNIVVKHRVFNDSILINCIPSGKLEPLFKLNYDPTNKELYQVLHYFLTHGPVINATNFHIGTPVLKYLHLTLKDKKVSISCRWNYQIWIEMNLYFKTINRTLINLKILMDYLILPELTNYQLSNTINWSNQTVSSFYSTITNNTNLIANDGNCHPLQLEGIEKTLLPFQSQSVKWMLQHEGVKLVDQNVESIFFDTNTMNDDQLSELLDRYTPGWTRVKFQSSNHLIEETVWWNPFNGGIVTTAFIKELNLSIFPPAKAFLCEEMGLGKTLEMISLIKCNPRKDILVDSKRDPFDYSRLVKECKTSLILCPETIISQWVDEIRYSSELNVFVYKGVMAMEQEDPTLTPGFIATFLAQFDIVLTSYNILARELDRAIFKPTERPKRSASSSFKRIDYSSPLMLLEFHRLVLDEAQLASISMSKVSKFTRILPRIHTWCVSGTLIRKNLNDLLSLVQSQRLYPLDQLSASDWENLPRNQFDRLVRSRCLRHTKKMVGNQVQLPNQKRILLRSPFTNIEWDNYSNLYNRFLQQAGLNENGEPIVEGFDIDRSKIEMRKWSSWLRMVCSHALLLKNTQDLGTNSKDEKISESDISEISIGTLDVVLKDLVKNTEMDIYHNDSGFIRDNINIGRIWEFLRKPEKSKVLFEKVIDELNLRIDLIKNKLKEINRQSTLEEEIVKADKMILNSRLMKYQDLLHQSYFLLASSHYQHYRPMFELPETFEELNTKIIELDEVEEKVIEVEALKEKEIIHYNIENEYYKKADMLINQILEFPLTRTKEMISKMTEEFGKIALYTPVFDPQLPEKDEILQEIDEEDEEEEEMRIKKENETSDTQLYNIAIPVQHKLLHSLKEPKPSLASQFICQRLLDTIEELDKQSDVINKWFTRLVELQKLPVTRGDEDLTGLEYSNSLSIQEESQALIDQIPLILSDRERTLNATELETKPVTTEADFSDDEDKEWVKKKRNGNKDSGKPTKKRKFNKSSQDKKNIFNKLNLLRLEFKPEACDAPKKTIKTALLELTDERQNLENSIGSSNRILSNETLIESIKQLNDCIKHLKSELNNQNKLLKFMKTKYLNMINDVFNSKISYYKALQSRSDDLVKYQPQKSNDLSPAEAALKEMRNLEILLEAHQSKVKTNTIRLNYLNSLNVSNDKEPNGTNSTVKETNDQCIICTYNILIGTLTSCGHKYCRDCLNEWMNTKPKCPLCQKEIKKNELYHFVSSKGGLRGDIVNSNHNELDKLDNSEEDDDSVDSEIRKLKNKRLLERDLNIVYSSISSEVLEEIGSIGLTRSYGTKIDMIIKQVKYLRKMNDQTQILIFSQWNKFLIILSKAMKLEGVTYKSWTEKNLTLPGRTGSRINPFSTVGRGNTGTKPIKGKFDKGESKLDFDIKEFKSNKQYSCFLLNTVAQAAGLTFTNASHVFLCEPMVNLSFELQAVSRIHRIGQDMETTVWNFVIEGSIEESIAYLSTKKRLEAAQTRGQNEQIEIDEDQLEASEMTKVTESDKREGELIYDDDLWATFFATKEAKIIENVYK